MATPIITADQQAAFAANTEFFVRRGMTKGYQWASLLAPPVYTAFVLTRRGPSQFSINRLLRATWLGGAAGVAGGGAFEFVRTGYSNEVNVQTRRIKSLYDTDSVRADDHSTIGALLFALLTPALLWKRARTPHLVLGGAGLGAAFGLAFHHGRNMSGDRPPKTGVPNVPAPTA